MKQQVEKIFNDLEEYLDFCRFELREFDPSHLYNRENNNWRAFFAFKKHGKNFKGRNIRKSNHTY
jgi:hypothetical protein